MNASEKVRKRLFALQDLKYKEFHSKLMPSVNSEAVIGVRTPALRKLVKELGRERELVSQFMGELPHLYYEENNVHGVLIAGMKDFEDCIAALNQFLPYIDNWATCDMLVPKVFKGRQKELLPHIERWLASDHTYTIRFGMKMLMDFYLDEEFSAKYLRVVSSVKSEEYYVNMMIAWYFATALAKQWDAAAMYFAEPGGEDADGEVRPVLEKWTHNKAIQKAIESFRITPEQKDYLRTLKIK